jgi:hypothetical protein
MPETGTLNFPPGKIILDGDNPLFVKYTGFMAKNQMPQTGDLRLKIITFKVKRGYGNSETVRQLDMCVFCRVPGMKGPWRRVLKFHSQVLSSALKALDLDAVLRQLQEIRRTEEDPRESFCYRMVWMDRIQREGGKQTTSGFALQLLAKADLPTTEPLRQTPQAIVIAADNYETTEPPTPTHAAYPRADRQEPPSPDVLAAPVLLAQPMSPPTLVAGWHIQPAPTRARNIRRTNRAARRMKTAGRLL